MKKRFVCTLFTLAVMALSCAALTRANSETTLRTISTFALGGVGYAGTMSEGERALRQMLKEPEALSRLEKMIANATPAGKLYCLLGLRKLDPPAYTRAVESCRSIDAKVETARGCIIGQEAFRDVVKEIESGQYDASLAREWPERAR
jgi:hypothetical protein